MQILGVAWQPRQKRGKHPSFLFSFFFSLREFLLFEQKRVFSIKIKCTRVQFFSTLSLEYYSLEYNIFRVLIYTLKNHIPRGRARARIIRIRTCLRTCAYNRTPKIHPHQPTAMKNFYEIFSKTLDKSSVPWYNADNRDRKAR